MAKLDNEHCYEHVPKLVETSHEGEVHIVWNQEVKIDRTIPDNNPDIIVHNKKGTCMVIDVAISGARNVIKKKPRRF